MNTLIVCVGLVWGMCGHAITVDYPTQTDCEKALARFEGKPNITYSYCKPKEQRK